MTKKIDCLSLCYKSTHEKIFLLTTFQYSKYFLCIIPYLSGVSNFHENVYFLFFPEKFNLPNHSKTHHREFDSLNNQTANYAVNLPPWSVLCALRVTRINGLCNGNGTTESSSNVSTIG